MKRLIVTALSLILLASPLMAQETDEVKSLSKKKIGQVIDLLRDKKLNKEDRNKRIIAVVNPLLDFDRMAMLSLGKTHWVNMTKEERKKFIDLFVIRLQESYLEKLDLYTDEEVEVADAEQVKNRIHVTTYLVSKTEKMEMVYKFYKTKDKGWMVYDVVILGVSVVQTYRSQFSGFLKNATYDQLFEKLKATGGFTISTEKK